MTIDTKGFEPKELTDEELLRLCELMFKIESL